jgi:uncharacterized protein (DUF924 family)
MTFSEVLNFWFHSDNKKNWFEKSSNFDNEVRSKYLDTYNSAAKGELNSWRDSAEGRLAEIIVLDQFSRNIFRNSPQAFATDSLALVLSQEAIRNGADKGFDVERKGFLYLPFMHSESAVIHQQALEVFSQKGMETYLEYEILHKKIIDRFGYYPHRNKIRGRKSTPEEEEFLKGPNSSF